ncbi:hypothetical protein [Bacillus sp. FJAT-49736]|uniref:hypothetical protein n=1 Tax=Bacillus sp. FJAT-49736 TaxID=2833582 RepID=UPI001BC9D26B|nr:hypothetical protein [Bacillus sp. FJAT-49736]MBS4174812.1 hypothetical protein [Bacillus sp. FJAT-49736]MBS4175531.1 hypothetical protein [Bacillus sp. FJAT-49736]
MEISVGGLVGLYGGLLIGGFGWWFGRKMAHKNRGIDELYHHIWQKARSYSWFATIAAIYILFSISALGVPLKVPMVLGVLLLVHLGSWAIIGMVMNFRMNVIPKPVNKATKIVLGVTIITISIIIFTTMSLVTQNWKFLLWSIIPNSLGIWSIIQIKEKAE